MFGRQPDRGLRSHGRRNRCPVTVVSDTETLISGPNKKLTNLGKRETEGRTEHNPEKGEPAKTEADRPRELEKWPRDEGAPDRTHRTSNNRVGEEPERDHQNKEPSPDGLRDPLRFVSRLLLRDTVGRHTSDAA